MASRFSSFKLLWDTIKTDLFKLCENFYFRKANLERINWANIVLIPKVETLESPGDYRVIGLINSSTKIISKMLASRLNKVINQLVDKASPHF